MSEVASRIYKPSDFSHGLVGEMLITLGKKGFSPEMAAEVANAKSGKAEGIVGLFPAMPNIVPFTDWQNFYRKFFSLELDFSQVRIPEKQVGFDRLIVVAQGLTLNQIYEVCDKHFKCWRYYDNLDVAIDWDKEERNSNNGHYAIWVRDRVEADEELKNLSANQIKEKGLKTETLRERKLHGFKYWSETKEHMDRNNTTSCTGSRVAGGGVPFVFWSRHYSKVCVSYYYPGYSYSSLRSREVVS
ncbi:MAG: hypothetical protein Q8Q95_03460 [bacterium]|nr:hypothetical protein [bacterium]